MFSLSICLIMLEKAENSSKDGIKGEYTNEEFKDCTKEQIMELYDN